MKKEKGKHIGLRIDNELHAKLVYVTKYEGRSINGQVLYLIRKCIAEFERTHEPIEVSKTEKA